MWYCRFAALIQAVGQYDIMKKFILSALLVLSYGTYALYNQPAPGIAPVSAPAATNDTKPVQQTQPHATARASEPPPPTILADIERWGEDEGDDDGPRVVRPAQTQPATQPAAPASNPAPAPAPAPTPTPAPATKPKGQYTDGTYTGAPADAYYGTVQVQATISGGKLTDVQFLSYPSDRSTSRQINSVAMPYLIQEAISAQSANVATVSGASHTSGAFRQSLGDALAQAKA